MTNIYDYISLMEAKPEMFTLDGSLKPLEHLLHGYCACLQANDITETYEGRVFRPMDFAAWLSKKTGWSASQGFAQAIEESNSGQESAPDVFFDLVEEFRASDPNH